MTPNIKLPRRDKQLELLDYNLKKLLENTPRGTNGLKMLEELNLLSFNLERKKELNSAEYHELKFLLNLIWVDIPVSCLMQILGQLGKPYSYSHQDIYWCFTEEKWKPFSARVNDYIGNNALDILDDYLLEYFEDYLDQKLSGDEPKTVLRLKGLINKYWEE